MALDRREALTKYAHKIPEGWSWEWFTDVMDVDGGTQPPASTFISQPRDGYVRLVQIRDFESDSHLTFIPDSKKWRKCRTSDVLIGRYGAALGRICTGLEGAYNVALAKVVPTEGIHLPFAYHLLRSSYFQGPLIAGGGRSAQAGFNKEGLSVIRLPIPPLPEQRAIAHILGTLDDKIELNRCRNQTLEAMARALFKDWFVDFGPVRAKMEGREPYLPADLWQLFPDRIDKDGKPEGWETRAVGDCFRLTMGQSPPGDTYNDAGDGMPFFQGRTDFGFRYPDNRKYCSAPTRLANAEDTLVSVRAPVGDINLAREQCCIGRGVAAVRHLSGQRSFTYYAIWSLQEELRQYEHSGTVFGAINKDQFRAMRFVEPRLELIESLEKRLCPLDDQIRNNIEESRALAQLRDTLLPKLISGELRIADAERFMEGAERRAASQTGRMS